MQVGTKVEFTGDRIGHNSAFTVEENIGKVGEIAEESTPGFWLVRLSDGSTLIACETELKEVQ